MFRDFPARSIHTKLSLPSFAMLALLALLASAAAPLTADAGCPYMTASIGGPSSISRLETPSRPIPRAPWAALARRPPYTWTVRTYNAELRLWTFPSTFQGGAN